MRAQNIEVVGHFIFASDLGHFRDVVDLGVWVLSLDFPDGKRRVSPQKIVEDVCDLDTHFRCDFSKDAVVAVQLSAYVPVRLMTGS